MQFTVCESFGDGRLALISAIPQSCLLAGSFFGSLSNFGVQESPASSNFDQILNIYKENAELYLLGEKSIEETMDKFLQQRADLMGK